MYKNDPKFYSLVILKMIKDMNFTIYQKEFPMILELFITVIEQDGFTSMMVNKFPTFISPSNPYYTFRNSCFIH